VNAWDIAGIILFLFFTIVYHAGYYVYAQRYPLATVKGKVHLYRRTWIKRIIDRNDYILGVQAFRNLITSSSFMASSSLLVMGIVLNSMLRSPEEIAATLHVEDAGDLQLKLGILIAVYAFSFMNFLFNIRFLNQLTVLMGADPDLIDHVEGVDAVEYFTAMLNSATNRYTFGQRGFYFSLAIIAWIFSSIAFVIVTAAIGIFLIAFMDFQRWLPPKALRRASDLPTEPTEAQQPRLVPKSP